MGQEFIVQGIQPNKYLKRSGDSMIGDLTLRGTPTADLHAATKAYVDSQAAGAPAGATYITQTSNATLTAEQVLADLATGIVKNTTTTGVLSIAAEGTDYYKPTGTDVALADGGTGSSTAAGALVNLGLTATAAELNILDGATLTVTELNYVDGVTSAIQTQINTKAPLASPTFTGTVTIPQLSFNSGDQDKIWFTTGGAAGSKIAHSASWSNDWYAGPGNEAGPSGLFRFFTTASSAYSERVRITAAGNVGIGTTVPVTKLQVGVGNTTADTAIAKFNTADADVAALELSNWDGAAATYGPRIHFDNSGVGTWYMGSSDGANNFDIAAIWGTPLLRVASTGNVGIGTTGPDSRLDVLATSGSQLRLTYTDGTVYSDFTVNSAGDLTIAPSGGDTTITGTLTTSSNLTAQGNLTIDGNTTLGNASVDTLTLNAGAITSASPTTWALANVANALNIDSNTLSVDALNNRVGIGTAGPQKKLHITSATFGDHLWIERTGGATAGISATSGAPTGLAIVDSGDNLRFMFDTTSGRLGVGTQEFGGTLSINGSASIGSGYTTSSPPTNGMLVEGNVGIGVTTPTAVLHLKAGTATASTAPLKFTSGTLMTTAEAGAIEFLTDTFYGTITTGAARKQFYIQGGTDVALADGGTGASDAATARTNLGLAIGTNVQAWDADLDTWATKTAPSGAVVGDTDTQTLSGKTLTTPKFADLGYIADANGNELIVMDTVATAVNELKVANAATGGSPEIAAQGGDTNISIQLTPKGTGIVKGELKRFMVQLLDSATNQTVATAIQGDFRISNRAITVKAVGCYCDTAGTTGTFTVDINEAGTSILSTKLTVDSAEKSSETAATPAVISDSAIAADAIITFDCDAIQTTAAKGLKIFIDYVYA